jgi:hypothetical protein
LVEEGRVRKYEFKIAMLETEIERNTTTLPGYNKASEQIRDMLENWYFAIVEEDEGKSPEGTNEQIDISSELSYERFQKELDALREELINRDNN